MINERKENIKLIRMIAGDWDKIFLDLFKKYESNSEERSRLQKIIKTDLKLMEIEEFPKKVIKFYSDYAESYFKKY